jgi:hypothetical protein
MTKWRYKQLEVGSLDTKAMIKINTLGETGWELVACVPELYSTSNRDNAVEHYYGNFNLLFKKMDK